jgi:hypothetical protein
MVAVTAEPSDGRADVSELVHHDQARRRAVAVGGSQSSLGGEQLGALFPVDDPTELDVPVAPIRIQLRGVEHQVPRSVGSMT